MIGILAAFFAAWLLVAYYIINGAVSGSSSLVEIINNSKVSNKLKALEDIYKIAFCNGHPIEETAKLYLLVDRNLSKIRPNIKLSRVYITECILRYSLSINAIEVESVFYAIFDWYNTSGSVIFMRRFRELHIPIEDYMLYSNNIDVSLLELVGQLNRMSNDFDFTKTLQGSIANFHTSHIYQLAKVKLTPDE